MTSRARGSRARCRAARPPAAAARSRPARASPPSPRCAAGGARAGGAARRPTRGRRGAARSCGHRPRLEHVELAVLDRPLDVLRDADPLLEVVAEAGELREQLVACLSRAAPLRAQRPPAHPPPPPRGDRLRLRLHPRPAAAAAPPCDAWV